MKFKLGLHPLLKAMVLACLIFEISKAFDFDEGHSLMTKSALQPYFCPSAIEDALERQRVIISSSGKMLEDWSFIDENFYLPSSKLLVIKTEIQSLAQAKQLDPFGIEMRELIGHALLIIQQFYGNTNWLELGHTTASDISPTLGMEIIPNPSPLSTPCLQNPNVVDTDILTSGYFNVSDPCSVAEGKCRLGKKGVCEGISKGILPTDHAKYLLSRAMAINASKKYLAEIIEKMPAEAEQRLLCPRNTMTLLVNTKPSMFDEIDSLLETYDSIVAKHRTNDGQINVIPFRHHEVGPIFPDVASRADLQAILSIVLGNESSSPASSSSGVVEMETTDYCIEESTNILESLHYASKATVRGGTIFLLTDGRVSDVEALEATKIMLGQRHQTLFAVLSGYCAREEPVYTILTAPTGGWCFIANTTSPPSQTTAALPSSYTQTLNVFPHLTHIHTFSHILVQSGEVVPIRVADDDSEELGPAQEYFMFTVDEDVSEIRIVVKLEKAIQHARLLDINDNSALSTEWEVDSVGQDVYVLSSSQPAKGVYKLKIEGVGNYLVHIHAKSLVQITSSMVSFDSSDVFGQMFSTPFFTPSLPLLNPSTIFPDSSQSQHTKHLLVSFTMPKQTQHLRVTFHSTNGLVIGEQDAITIYTTPLPTSSQGVSAGLGEGFVQGNGEYVSVVAKVTAPVPAVPFRVVLTGTNPQGMVFVRSLPSIIMPTAAPLTVQPSFDSSVLSLRQGAQNALFFLLKNPNDFEVKVNVGALAYVYEATSQPVALSSVLSRSTVVVPAREQAHIYLQVQPGEDAIVGQRGVLHFTLTFTNQLQPHSFHSQWLVEVVSPLYTQFPFDGHYLCYHSWDKFAAANSSDLVEPTFAASMLEEGLFSETHRSSALVFSEASCGCAKGWRGLLCTEVDVQSESGCYVSCYHHGVCVPAGLGEPPVCQCSPLYFGPHCETERYAFLTFNNALTDKLVTKLYNCATYFLTLSTNFYDVKVRAQYKLRENGQEETVSIGVFDLTVSKTLTWTLVNLPEGPLEIQLILLGANETLLSHTLAQIATPASPEQDSEFGILTLPTPLIPESSSSVTLCSRSYLELPILFSAENEFDLEVSLHSIQDTQYANPLFAQTIYKTSRQIAHLYLQSANLLPPNATEASYVLATRRACSPNSAPAVSAPITFSRNNLATDYTFNAELPRGVVYDACSVVDLSWQAATTIEHFQGHMDIAVEKNNAFFQKVAYDTNARWGKTSWVAPWPTDNAAYDYRFYGQLKCGSMDSDPANTPKYYTDTFTVFPLLPSIESLSLDVEKLTQGGVLNVGWEGTAAIGAVQFLDGNGTVALQSELLPPGAKEAPLYIPLTFPLGTYTVRLYSLCLPVVSRSPEDWPTKEVEVLGMATEPGAEKALHIDAPAFSLTRTAPWCKPILLSWHNIGVFGCGNDGDKQVTVRLGREGVTGYKILESFSIETTYEFLPNDHTPPGDGYYFEVQSLCDPALKTRTPTFTINPPAVAGAAPGALFQPGAVVYGPVHTQRPQESLFSLNQCSTYSVFVENHVAECAALEVSLYSEESNQVIGPALGVADEALHNEISFSIDSQYEFGNYRFQMSVLWAEQSPFTANIYTSSASPILTTYSNSVAVEDVVVLPGHIIPLSPPEFLTKTELHVSSYSRLSVNLHTDHTTPYTLQLHSATGEVLFENPITPSESGYLTFELIHPKRRYSVPIGKDYYYTLELQCARKTLYTTPTFAVHAPSDHEGTILPPRVLFQYPNEFTPPLNPCHSHTKIVLSTSTHLTECISLYVHSKAKDEVTVIIGTMKNVLVYADISRTAYVPLTQPPQEGVRYVVTAVSCSAEYQPGSNSSQAVATTSSEPFTFTSYPSHAVITSPAPGTLWPTPNSAYFQWAWLGPEGPACQHSVQITLPLMAVPLSSSLRLTPTPYGFEDDVLLQSPNSPSAIESPPSVKGTSTLVLGPAEMAGLTGSYRNIAAVVAGIRLYYPSSTQTSPSLSSSWPIVGSGFPFYSLGINALSSPQTLILSTPTTAPYPEIIIAGLSTVVISWETKGKPKPVMIMANLVPETQEMTRTSTAPAVVTMMAQNTGKYTWTPDVEALQAIWNLSPSNSHSLRIMFTVFDIEGGYEVSTEESLALFIPQPQDLRCFAAPYPTNIATYNQTTVIVSNAGAGEDEEKTVEIESVCRNATVGSVCGYTCAHNPPETYFQTLVEGIAKCEINVEVGQAVTSDPTIPISSSVSVKVTAQWGKHTAQCVSCPASPVLPGFEADYVQSPQESKTVHLTRMAQTPRAHQSRDLGMHHPTQNDAVSVLYQGKCVNALADEQCTLVCATNTDDVIIALCKATGKWTFHKPEELSASDGSGSPSANNATDLSVDYCGVPNVQTKPPAEEDDDTPISTAAMVGMTIIPLAVCVGLVLYCMFKKPKSSRNRRGVGGRSQDNFNGLGVDGTMSSSYTMMLGQTYSHQSLDEAKAAETARVMNNDFDCPGGQQKPTQNLRQGQGVSVSEAVERELDRQATARSQSGRDLVHD